MNGDAGPGGDAADVFRGCGDLVRAEVLDEGVAIGVGGVEAVEEEGHVEFALAGDGFVQVDHEAVAGGDVFDVADRGEGTHQVEDVVEAVGAGVDLPERLEVVDRVHDEPEAGAVYGFDDGTAGFGGVEDGDGMGFQDRGDAFGFEVGKGRFEGFDEALHRVGPMIVPVGRPGACGVEAAGADEVGLGVELRGDFGPPGDLLHSSLPRIRIGVKEAVAVGDGELGEIDAVGGKPAFAAGRIFRGGLVDQVARKVKAGAGEAQVPDGVEVIVRERAKIAREHADDAEAHGWPPDGEVGEEGAGAR